MRIRVALAALGLIVGSAAIGSAQPSAAGPKPLRSGTIEGGTGLRTSGGQPWDNPAIQRSGCEYAADCLAWLLSGCDPALAGHEPAVTTAIVDVARLANGRTSRTLQTTAPRIPPWGLFPGVVVQFWLKSCTEMENVKTQTRRSGTCRANPYPVVQCEGLRIPKGATWMTLSAYSTTAHLTWTLS